MRCEKCGGRTTVVDSRSGTALDDDTRLRAVEWSLAEDVREHAPPGPAGLRMRFRRCRDCGYSYATVELSRAGFEAIWAAAEKPRRRRRAS